MQPNVTGYLVYNNKADYPDPQIVNEFDDFDDFTLVPGDGEALLPDPDVTVTLAIAMINLDDGKN
jgi:iron transport multicopper oxidase